jgi:cell division protein FtsI (penicillin-binding protein 3)
MHFASFAGIAPVNNPVIAVAVVLDNPKGGGISYYGGAASAPVFTQVAQDTLEYLGVPHDIELHAARPSTKDLTAKDIEPEQEHTGDDAKALMAAVNDLPPDDPLREAVNNAHAPVQTVVKVPVKASSKDGDKKSETSAQEAKSNASTLNAGAASQPQVVAVALPAGNSVKVPSLIGMPVREVVEQVALAGLNLQVQGRGLVRSQEPAAGSQVQPGSQIIVHCAR